MITCWNRFLFNILCVIISSGNVILNPPDLLLYLIKTGFFLFTEGKLCQMLGHIAGVTEQATQCKVVKVVRFNKEAIWFQVG